MYGVKCTVYEDTSVHTLSGVLPNKVYNELYFEELDWKEHDGFADVQYCKPYLFPLSSMTEKQKKEFELLFDLNYASAYSQELQIAANMLKWLNKNHFDIYGLIPMDLAIDATGLNIY